MNFYPSQPYFCPPNPCVSNHANNMTQIYREIMMGPEGPQGPIGAQGHQGVTGAQGSTGNLGLTGVCWGDYIFWNDQLSPPQWDVGSCNINLGCGAGEFDQGVNGIALGYQSGQFNQDTYGISIGWQAGYTGQSLQGIAIGTKCANYLQEMNAISIGAFAGFTAQKTEAIAIGTESGSIYQGRNAVSIGNLSGNYYQGEYSVALGNESGYRDQSTNAVAVGSLAGYSNQAVNSIAIGAQSGFLNQGSNCVAIGFRAGATDQSSNSIILNATGQVLNADSSGFFVAPIRSASTSNYLYYDTSINEIIYQPASFLYATATSDQIIPSSSGSNDIIWTGDSNTNFIGISSTIYQYKGKASKRFLIKIGNQIKSKSGLSNINIFFAIRVNGTIVKNICYQYNLVPNTAFLDHIALLNYNDTISISVINNSLESITIGEVPSTPNTGGSYMIITQI
jgi:hypothetical protein